jgi:hypothetical protein
VRIDLSDGVQLVGDEEELRDLAADLERAADGEAVEASLLTNNGVERFVIRCEP